MTKKNQSQGLLAALPPHKLNLLLGEVTSLLMASKVHRRLEIRDFADIILPALNINQYRIYRDQQGAPVALVTWGKFSPEVEEKYLKGDVVLSESDLMSGDSIYLTDFIAPYGHTKQVANDLKNNVFPNDSGKAIRFDEIGKPRPKVWEFRGANHGKKNN